MMALFIVVNANPVSLELAQNVGAKFVRANGQRGNELQLVSTCRTDNGTAVFYVFNTSNGFVIVSADDCATPILAYSNEGPLDIDDIPVQMNTYLQGFVEQIQYGIENHLVADANVARQWEMVQQDGRINDDRNATEVAPMLTDVWHQGCYYNMLCPSDPEGPCEHTVTGCTGTAMAQIIRFWGYPVSGTGSTTYTPPGYPQQSVNFAQTTYDYANMPDDLTYYSSQTQKTATATLLWHCGVALHAQYSPQGTGAFPSDVPDVLRNYFRYGSELNAEFKQDNTAWLTQVKNCLDQGRPIHYSAWTLQDGGHSFVCDGYNTSDELHINWGWGGNGNGYFAVTAFEVNGYNFSVDHYAIFNIHPRVDCTISVSASPSNGGTATGGGVIEQGQNCTVHATANSGYAFVNWTENGSQVSTNANYSFTVTGDRTLVANFELIPTYTITTSASPSNGGTATGGGTYQQGQTCTVHATASSGYSFTNWTENGSQVSTNADYSFTVNANRDLVANFELIPTYTITTSSSPSNGGTATGGGTYQQGQTCSVHATASSGYSFANWTENGTQVSTSANYSFVVSANRTLVANFIRTTFTISTSSNPSNGGTTSGGGSYQLGQTCTVHATASSGYTFTNWTENGSQVSNNADYSFTVNADRVLVANFDETEYEIAAICNPENGGTITGVGTYHYGDEVILKVEPNTYYFFESWTEGGEIVSTEPQITFTVEGNRSLTANLYYFDAVNDNEENLLRVYPNPTNEVVNIEGAALEVKIYNALGQLVVSEKNNAQQLMQINVSQLETGIYTIVISTTDRVYEYKIVKR